MAKTGGKEVNGDRGTHNRPKTKQGKADEERRGPRSIAQPFTD